jgi:hypothetical protein
MDNWFLQHMYQQWQQGQNDYEKRVEDFVKMAAHYNDITTDQMIKILKQYPWFNK